ncbi:hypothetical protein EVAR_59238_1 [Eumeta japonica]|uniref:Uncharacterized protein n=1 Tax=Eumeta variegata TaxID=151549 RepID=A0A4C1ZHA9_EUMVA|nr:hypothetical protein EVAR_59238_1 [Eumeta japonica]
MQPLCDRGAARRRSAPEVYTLGIVLVMRAAGASVGRTKGKDAPLVARHRVEGVGPKDPTLTHCEAGTAYDRCQQYDDRSSRTDVFNGLFETRSEWFHLSYKIIGRYVLHHDGTRMQPFSSPGMRHSAVRTDRDKTPTIAAPRDTTPEAFVNATAPRTNLML